MSYWISVYRSNLKMAIAQMLAYRLAIMIWAVWGFVGPLISLAVWSAVSGANSSPIKGAGQSFSRQDFAAYYLLFMIFGHLTMSWDAFEFAYRIQSGSLSPRLLKPLHPIHTDVAFNIAFKLCTTAMVLPAWIVLYIVLRPTPPHSMTTLLLAIPALGLAAALRYVTQYALATVAFWTTRVEAINQLYFTVDSFLSGRIAPLGLLPGFVGTFAVFSPFRAMGAFPVELALGRVHPQDIVPGFCLQLFWLSVVLFAFKALWAGGVKQYSAVGA